MDSVDDYVRLSISIFETNFTIDININPKFNDFSTGNAYIINLFIYIITIT